MSVSCLFVDYFSHFLVAMSGMKYLFMIGLPGKKSRPTHQLAKRMPTLTQLNYHFS